MRGFSLLELLLVIFLLGLVFVLVLPSLHFFDKIAIRIEVDKLYMLIGSLHQEAVASGVRKVLTFNINDNSYSFDDVVEHLSGSLMFGFLSGAKGPPSKAIYFIKDSVTFVDRCIVFYPNGKISAGTIYIINKGRNFMYAITVAISQVSYIRKYRYCKRWIII